MIDLVRPLDSERDHSPLAQARLARQWTREQAAKRSGLTADEVEWLEEGRVYRFPSTDDALLAAWLYATGLGLELREARELAGLPVPPRPLQRNPRGRLAALAAVAATLLIGLGVFVGPRGRDEAQAVQQPVRSINLPKPSEIEVAVLNGAGDIDYTRRVANRIQSLAYLITAVRRADRFDYPATAVYYPPGGEQIAVRLARELGVVTKPLPGGKNPHRLVVIVGPRKGPG